MIEILNLFLNGFIFFFAGRNIKYSRPGTRKQDIYSFVPSFEWLRPGDRIGLKKTTDSRVLVYYNSELLETAFERVPDVSIIDSGDWKDLSGFKQRSTG